MKFDTVGFAAFLESNNIKAMDLVRTGKVSVTSAYKLVNGQYDHVDLNVLYKVYQALLKLNVEVTWQELTGIV